MPWWGWILVGAILLGSELFVATEFYLVFLGLAAIVVGAAAALFDLDVWQHWAAFAAMAILFLVGFRPRIREWMTSSDANVRDRMVGETATVSERIEPGATGNGELRGSVWRMKNVGDAALETGEQARAVGMDGLTLEVRREN